MLNVFLALVAIAGVGSALHNLVPELDIESTRRQCGALVLNVLLPALNIEVIYKSTVGSDLWQIPLAMLVGAAVCVASALAVFSVFPLSRKLKSSLILASSFGNVTYLGMPLLQGLFPRQLLHVTEIAILCEIMVTSADLITGALLAMFYEGRQQVAMSAALAQVVKFPLLWSAALAIGIRTLGIPLPGFSLTALHLLGQSTSGLMLLVLGMALKPSVLAGSLSKLDCWWPLLMIKLGLSPLIVGLTGTLLGLTALNLHAATIEAAMPPQLFIFIIADRFGFDVEVLAAAVALMTVMSVVTVPVVHRVLI